MQAPPPGPPPVQYQSFFKPKPPKLGDNPGEKKLGEWLSLMTGFLRMDHLMDLIENWDVPIDQMNDAMLYDNERAKYCLLSHIGEKYFSLVQDEPRARDIWFKLKEVKCFYYLIVSALVLCTSLDLYPFTISSHKTVMPEHHG